LPDTPKIGQVTYAELRSGFIHIGNQKIRTAPVASLSKARKIAELLKKAILEAGFEINPPVKFFPDNTSLKSLQEIGKTEGEPLL
jgi:uncharacterized protein (DUF39 family)